MKDLSAIDFKDNVRYVVRRYLKTLGIKVPKQKSSKSQVSHLRSNAMICELNASNQIHSFFLQYQVLTVISFAKN